MCGCSTCPALGRLLGDFVPAEYVSDPVLPAELVKDQTQSGLPIRPSVDRDGVRLLLASGPTRKRSCSRIESDGVTSPTDSLSALSTSIPLKLTDTVPETDSEETHLRDRSFKRRGGGGHRIQATPCRTVSAVMFRQGSAGPRDLLVESDKGKYRRRFRRRSANVRSEERPTVCESDCVIVREAVSTTLSESVPLQELERLSEDSKDSEVDGDVDSLAGIDTEIDGVSDVLLEGESVAEPDLERICDAVAAVSLNESEDDMNSESLFDAVTSSDSEFFVGVSTRESVRTVSELENVNEFVIDSERDGSGPDKDPVWVVSDVGVDVYVIDSSCVNCFVCEGDAATTYFDRVSVVR